MRTNRPLGTAEVLEEARSEVGGLGIATIYRNIRTLLDEGWLVQVDLPGEVPRYEIAGKPHHHHFRCEQCHRVYDLAGCIPSFQQLVPTGFRLARHELVLYGTCDACAVTS